MTKRERRTFTKEFKEQMVQLYMNGKPRKDIIQDYNLTPFSLDKWINQYNTSGSFKEADNRTPEESELIELFNRNFFNKKYDRCDFLIIYNIFKFFDRKHFASYMISRS
ncbi:transposase [Brevibacillus laterosporus]|nr:transposase [Brevibacillus laterosporus]MBM7110320.1 Transposase [Brevibacillus laterosporus]